MRCRCLSGYLHAVKRDDGGHRVPGGRTARIETNEAMMMMATLSVPKTTAVREGGYLLVWRTRWTRKNR